MFDRAGACGADFGVLLQGTGRCGREPSVHPGNDDRNGAGIPESVPRIYERNGDCTVADYRTVFDFPGGCFQDEQKEFFENAHRYSLHIRGFSVVFDGCKRRFLAAGVISRSATVQRLDAIYSHSRGNAYGLVHYFRRARGIRP